MNILTQMRDRREAIDEELLSIAERAAENPDISAGTFTEDEATRVESLISERGKITDRIEELIDQQASELRAAQAAQAIGSVSVTSEPNPVYRKDGSQSFFRDKALALHGDSQAVERLAASQVRAQSTAVGAGGEFAPPLWLVDEFVQTVRAGRVTADLFTKQALPAGVSSINMPKILTGQSVGDRGTEAGAVPTSTLTTSKVTGTIETIAGQNTISRELIDQSGINFDQVILSDLAAAYAQQIGVKAVTKVGALAGANAVAVTAAKATGDGSLYAGIAQGIVEIQTNRLAAPNAVVMHPRRWSALLQAYDTANRPLVVPNPGQGFNVVATAVAGNPVQQVVGTILGLPVLTDPNIPINLGAASNQDEVFVAKWDDLYLYESEISAEAFEATYANNGEILYRIWGYASFILDRYPAAVSVLTGAGLV